MTYLAYAGAVGDQPAAANEATTLRYDSAPERRRAILSAVGDTGFFVETQDATLAHIHFDSITATGVQPG